MTDPVAELKARAELFISQLAINGWKALPCAVCRRAPIIGVNALHNLLRDLLQALGEVGARPPAPDARGALEAVAAWFKEMDDPEGPYDVKSGLPVDIDGHMERLEQLRDVAIAAVSKALADPAARPAARLHEGEDTYPKPPDGWVCFHCGERFTTPGSAADHFGATPESIAGCLIDYVALEEGGKPERGRGLLMALRKSEAQVRALEARLRAVLQHAAHVKARNEARKGSTVEQRAWADGYCRCADELGAMAAGHIERSTMIMAEFKRTFFCHPTKGGEFDLTFHSRDAVAHSMVGDLPLPTVTLIQAALTEASSTIHGLLLRRKRAGASIEKTHQLHLHVDLSAIVGCGSPDGRAELDQVQMMADELKRLREENAYLTAFMDHCFQHHSLPDICCPDKEAVLASPDAFKHVPNR